MERPASLVWEAFIRAFWATILGLTFYLLSTALTALWPPTWPANPFSSFIQRSQDVSVDTWQNWLYKIPFIYNPPFTGAPAQKDFPRVYLVGLDEQYQRQVFEDERDALTSPRARFAELLETLESFKPRAVFLDLNLGDTANESGEPSKGDTTLQLVLAKPRDYLLLVPNTTLFYDETQDDPGGWGWQKYPGVCPTNAGLIWDNDGRVRRILPTSDTQQPFSASYYLFILGTRADISSCQDLQTVTGGKVGTPDNLLALGDSYGGWRSRVMFRPWRGFRAATPGVADTSSWLNASYVPAGSVLQGGQLGEGAVFIVGNTITNPKLALETYPALSLDRFVTPVGELMGVEIHFHALMTFVHYGLPTYLKDFAQRGLSFVLAFVFLFLSYWLAKLVTARIAIPLIGETFELLIMWVIMTVPALYLMNRYGLFLEFVIPTLAVQLWSVYYKAIKNSRG